MTTSPTGQSVSPTLFTQHVQRRGNWKMLAKTQAEEDAFDFQALRPPATSLGVLGSLANMIKGALGAGLLGGHVAYMKGGIIPSIMLNAFFAFYIGYSLFLLVETAQILYKRTKVTMMTYPDVGEAAVQCHPNPKISRYSTAFRYTIDGIVCLDLFGTCCCYQIIISKCLKQLVENTQTTTIEGLPGYPNLRVYLVAMIIPLSIICLIRYLKWLAPFSLVANMGIVFCVGMAIYFAFQNNPEFKGLRKMSGTYQIFEMVGINIYSMSAAGIAVPVENSMREPKKYKYVISTAYIFIFTAVFSISFFGYAAYLEKCQAPITVNFPPYLAPMVLKCFLPFMIYVTHALVFWVPFDLVFCYIKPHHNQDKIVMWEYFYRVVFVVMCAVIAIIFPNVNALMGFLGSFCLSNMAFIWPNVIYLFVISHRPGFGKYRWKLWKGIFLIVVGSMFLVCGSYVSLRELIFGKA